MVIRRVGEVKVPSPTPGDKSARSGFDLRVNVAGVSRTRLPGLSLELGGASVFSPPQGIIYRDKGGN